MAIISLDLKIYHQIAEISTLYQLTTDPGVNTQSQLQLQQTINNGNKYFLRIERKLQRGKKDDFLSKHGQQSFTVLRSFIQLMLICINKMRIIQQQREQQQIKLAEALESKVQFQDNQVQEELSRISQQNDNLKKLLQIQKAIDEFLDELKQSQKQQGIMYFEQMHLKLFSFIHVLIPKCKRMQLFMSKDSQGQNLYTYINQPNKESPSNTRSHSNNPIGIVDQLMQHQEKALPRSSSAKRLISSGKNNSRNPNLLYPMKVTGNSTGQNNPPARPQTQVQYTNYQNIIVPSLMDDISSISGGGFFGQGENPNMCQDKHSVGGVTSATYLNYRGCPIARTQDHFPGHLSLYQNNPIGRNALQDSLTRQPSGFNIVGSSSSTNLLPRQTNESLKRDYSAQTDLNAPRVVQQVPFTNLQDFVQQRTNSSETPQNQRQINSSPSPDIKVYPIAGQKKTILTSYDELFHSNLHDDSEQLQVEDILSIQDPQKIKRVEIDLTQSRSLVREAIEQGQLVKRNAKKDKAYKEDIDGLVYREPIQKGKQRVLENVIIMPIVNQGKVLGVIQLVNSEKQLTFTQEDLDIVNLLSSKLGTFITEIREFQAQNLIFKKQLDLSLLHQGLERQSITQILSLANQLFQRDHKDPVLAVGYFVKKTEKYLRQVFNCQYSQILIVDQEREGIYSFDIQDQKARLIKRGEAYSDYSITNALIKGNFQEPIVWPGINENQDESQSIQNEKIPQTHQNFYAQFLNYYLDCPLVYTQQETPQTYLSLTIRHTEDTQRVIAVLQLLQRTSNFPFTEQDISHLSLLCEHLSQVFTYIHQQGLLTQYSESQIAKLTGLFKVMEKRHRADMKLFFRELLAFKFGKVNLLKNKIVRKYMDRHMRIDQKLIDGIAKLVEIREKCTLSNKGRALRELKKKVQKMNEQRQRNAVKCIKVVTKYEKLLGIRVKDTVFRFWDKIRREGGNLISNQSQINITEEASMSPTFNRGNTDQSMVIHDTSCNISSISCAQNQSSILDESSITSVLYLRAKSIYKMKKIFNNYRLKRLFDTFAIKAFYRNGPVTNIHIKRMLIMHNILLHSVKLLNFRVFNAFLANSKVKRHQIKSLSKVASRRAFRDMSFGLKQWQNHTEKSLKNEMRQDKTFISQLAEQQRDCNLLHSMMNGINQVFSQNRNPYQTIEEFLQSNQFKLMMSNIADQILEVLSHYKTGTHQSQLVFTFKLPDNYCLSECCPSQYALFINPEATSEHHYPHLSSLLTSLSPDRQQYTSISGDFHPPPLNLDDNHISSMNLNAPQPQVYLMDGSRDAILRHISITLSPYVFNRGEGGDDPLIGESLRTRSAESQMQGMAVPMVVEPIHTMSTSVGVAQMLGSLEIYNRMGLSNEEQARIKMIVQVLQTGFQTLIQQLSMIHQIYSITHSIPNPPPLRRLSTTESILSLTTRIQRLFHADHTLLIFQPSPDLGVFFNFDTNQLYSFSVQDTIIGDLSSYTEDISLCFPDSPDIYESVTGLQFQSLKYMVIQPRVYVEIGWISRQEQQQSSEAVDRQVRGMVRDQVDRMERQMKIFTRAVGRKLLEVVREEVYRPWFARWKRNCYMDRVLGLTPAAEEERVRFPISTTERKRRSHSQAYQKSPAFQTAHTRGRSLLSNQNLYPTFAHQTSSHLRSSHDRSRHRRSNSQGSLNSHLSNHQQDQTNILSELDVEKAAKRKLVSASLLMIALQAKWGRKLQTQNAFAEWKAYIRGSQIAEGAFNKLLEINHRHSKVRFETAAAQLSKVIRRHYGAQMIQMLTENTQRPPQQFKRTMNASPRGSSSYYQRVLNAPRVQEQNDTGESFEQEIFALDSNHNVVSRRPEEEADSEFSLGTSGNGGTKSFGGAMIPHSQRLYFQDPAQVYTQVMSSSNENGTHRSLKPKHIASQGAYQNMFKRQ